MSILFLNEFSFIPCSFISINGFPFHLLFHIIYQIPRSSLTKYSNLAAFAKYLRKRPYLTHC